MADTVLNPLKMFKDLDVDETAGGVQILAGPGRVSWIYALNLDATPVYLKFFDQTTVVVGTTVPDLTIGVPAVSPEADGGVVDISIPGGLLFSTGINIIATTGFADNDTTGPGTNELIVNIGYTDS